MTNTVHNFFRTRLIYKVSKYIAERRNKLLADLVAYSNDSTRYNRRVRMLHELATYEAQIITQISTFATDDFTDLTNMVELSIYQDIAVLVDPDA